MKYNVREKMLFIGGIVLVLSVLTGMFAVMVEIVWWDATDNRDNFGHPLAIVYWPALFMAFAGASAMAIAMTWTIVRDMRSARQR